MITSIFDVGFILEEYGIFAVFVEIFLLEILHAHTIGEAYTSPCYLLSADITATMPANKVQ